MKNEKNIKQICENYFVEVKDGYYRLFYFGDDYLSYGLAKIYLGIYKNGDEEKIKERIEQHVKKMKKLGVLVLLIAVLPNPILSNVGLFQTQNHLHTKIIKLAKVV